MQLAALYVRYPEMSRRSWVSWDAVPRSGHHGMSRFWHTQTIIPYNGDVSENPELA